MKKDIKPEGLPRVECSEIEIIINPIEGWTMLDHYHVQYLNKEILVIQTKPPRLKKCPYCGSNSLEKFGKRKKPARFWDSPIYSGPVLLEVSREKYFCRSCPGPPNDNESETASNTAIHVSPQKRYLMPPLTGVDVPRRSTHHLIRYVKRRSLNEPFLKVQRDTGLDNTTIRKIFLEHVRYLDDLRSLLPPETLWLHQAPRKYCVLVNLKVKGVLEVLKDSTQSTVESSLRTHSSWDPSSVVMDMHAPLVKAAKAALPKAEHAVTKIDIQELGEKIMSKVLIKLRTQVPFVQGQALDAVLSGLPDGSHRFRYLIDELRALNISERLLWSTCKCYLKFLEIWESASVEEARTRHRSWASSIPPEIKLNLQPLVETIKRLDDLLFTAFNFLTTEAEYIADLRIAIRKINEAGRAYRLDVFRGKVLYSQGTQLAGQPGHEAAPVKDTFLTDLQATMERDNIAILRTYPVYGSSILKLLENAEHGRF